MSRARVCKNLYGSGYRVDRIVNDESLFRGSMTVGGVHREPQVVASTKHKEECIRRGRHRPVRQERLGLRQDTRRGPEGGHRHVPGGQCAADGEIVAVDIRGIMGVAGRDCQTEVRRQVIRPNGAV